MSADRRTLVDVLRARATRSGNDAGYTFLVDGEHEGAWLSYAELDARARSIAVALLDHGIAPGDRALLLYPPGLDFIPAFFGCLYAGVVAIPAYPPQPAQLSRTLPRLLSIVADADVTAVLSTSEIAADGESMARHGSALRAVTWLRTDALASDDVDGWRPPSVDGDSLAFLQYTSGSTATPRGVMVSHANLLHNLGYARAVAGNDETATSVSWLPVIHDMGLIEGVLQPLFAGYSAYLMAPAAFLQRPIRWLRAITRYAATNSGGPNFAYDLCVRKISDAQRQELNLETWRIAYNGSEPVRRDTMAAFHERFRGVGFRWQAFCPAYGLAESTLMVTTTGPEHEAVVRETDTDSLARGRLGAPPAAGATTRSLVSSGRASFGTRVVIVDPETAEACVDGRVGEIWVASPSVARGYWRRDRETVEAFGARLANGDGPFLRTGDLGVSCGGEIFVTGRLKDVLIVRGLKHYPQDLELTAEQADDAIRAGCSAAFYVDGVDGESVAIALEVDLRQLPPHPADRDARLEAIEAAVRQSIVEHHGIVLSAVLLLSLGGMAKTSSGKLQRGACRAAFLDGSLNEIARSPICHPEELTSC